MRNEHRSIRLLEAAGCRCIRAVASLGAWDVAGIGRAGIVLLQVKTRDWPGTVEIEVLKRFAAPTNCHKVMHRWRGRQILPDMKDL
jgi:hypothetical protein